MYQSVWKQNQRVAPERTFKVKRKFDPLKPIKKFFSKVNEWAELDNPLDFISFYALVAFAIYLIFLGGVTHIVKLSIILAGSMGVL